MTTTENPVRWLTTDEQRSWRSWLSAHILMSDALDREMKADNGISMADYEILVRLSESPHRMRRMSELADNTLSSRSRLSHQVARMELAGWVERRECADDRRGTLCVMTDRGWELLVRAAPSHVASVRRHLVDVLSTEEFAATGAACHKLVEAMLAERAAADLPPAGVPPSPR